MTVALLRTMLLIRRFEAALQKRPDHGFQLLSAGQEAVSVGLASVLEDGDQLLSGGRSIAPALARGLDPGAVMAELVGRATGPCGGRAGRGHLAQPGAGFFGAHAVVAGNISIAAGVALALQAEGRGRIVACLFGDGACGAGALHETLNISSLWRLPLLLVCDNNLYSVSTPRSAALAPEKLSDLAKPFGIRAATVDGMDVLAVRDAAASFAAAARAGEGPAFLECVSRRFAPHSTSARETRGREEMAEALALDPIVRFGATISADRLAALTADVDAVVAQACRFADASPFPSPEAAFADVG
jgi:TPP-dependent pyruvate/acetoin dehydrogenase alpha subunit